MISVEKIDAARLKRYAGRKMVLFHLSSASSLEWNELQKENWHIIYNIDLLKVLELIHVIPDCSDIEKRGDLAQKCYDFVSKQLEYIISHNGIGLDEEVFFMVDPAYNFAEELEHRIQQDNFRLAKPVFAEETHLFTGWKYSFL